MKSNTQNAKIETITEKFGYSELMSKVKCTMPELLITEESSIRRNHLSFVTQRLDLRHLRNEFWFSKKNMKRIRWFQAWNQPVTIGSSKLKHFLLVVLGFFAGVTNENFEKEL